MKALIIGKGPVGLAAAAEFHLRDISYEFKSGRGIDPTFLCQLARTDLLVVAIDDNGDRGLAALQYALCGLESGKIVVTPEKGALAYNFDLLRPFIIGHRFGFMTTVGGASGMLSLVWPPRPEQILGIIGIINGTLNFLPWHIEKTGCGPYEAMKEAFRLNLADCRSDSLAEVVATEIRDSIMKAAIIWNLSGLGPVVSADGFSYGVPSETEAERLLSTPGKRFVLNIQKSPRVGLPEPGFYLRVGQWNIIGSFMPNADRAFRDRLPEGAANRLVVNTISGWETRNGIGAGAGHTAKALVEEAEKLLVRGAAVR